MQPPTFKSWASHMIWVKRGEKGEAVSAGGWNLGWNVLGLGLETVAAAAFFACLSLALTTKSSSSLSASSMAPSSTTSIFR